MAYIERKKYRVIENHVAKLTLIVAVPVVFIILLTYFLFVWL